MRPGVRPRSISNQEIFKDRDSVMEQSNTLIEQSSHATERVRIIKSLSPEANIVLAR